VQSAGRQLEGPPGVARHEAGDHFLCVGEIESARVQPGEPLLYFGGGYGRFLPGRE